MSTLRYRNCRLAGVTATHPANEVDNSDLAAQLGVDANRVKLMTGIDARRMAKPDVCASDLCYDSAKRLMEELGWAPESIGAVVFVSQTPDYTLPATACILQHRLGLPPTCLAFDVNMGCSGYVYGLATVFGLVEGGVDRAILLVGDTVNRIVSDTDKSVAFLFGDAGSASAIERSPSASTFVLGTDGSGADHLIVHGGRSRHPFSADSLARNDVGDGNARNEIELEMNGAEVMAFALRVVPQLFTELIEESGVSRDDLFAVVMHQANQFLLDRLAKKIGIDASRVPSSVPMFGNTSCASIPVTLSEVFQGASFSPNSRIALLGFGVGWSWGGCVVETDRLVVVPTNNLTHL